MKSEHAKTFEDYHRKLKGLIVTDCIKNSLEPLLGFQTSISLLPISNVYHLHYNIEFLLMN